MLRLNDGFGPGQRRERLVAVPGAGAARSDRDENSVATGASRTPHRIPVRTFRADSVGAVSNCACEGTAASRREGATTIGGNGPPRADGDRASSVAAQRRREG